MIPKILHYVWVGPSKLPDSAKRMIATWEKHCPDYEIKQWSEDNIDLSSRFMREAYGVRAWNRVANLARVEAIHKHGGIYLDTDIELMQSLDPLLQNKAFVGFQSKHKQGDWVNNAVLAAEPGHWLPGAVIDALTHRHGYEGLYPGNSSFGPGQLSKVLFANGLATYDDTQPVMVRDVAVYPVRYFYPYAWNEEFTPACVTPDTFTVHYWDASWIKNTKKFRLNGFRRKMRGVVARHFPDLLFQHTLRDVTRSQNAGAI